MEHPLRAGRCSNVRFSPDESLAAFVYESYENSIDARILLGHIDALAVVDVFKFIVKKEPTLPPSSFEFGSERDSLLLSTLACGRTTIQTLSLSQDAVPETIFNNGSAGAYYPLVEGQWGKLLVSSASFLDSSLWQIIDTKGETEPVVVSSLTRHGARFGLTHAMVSEIWYEGADDSCIHAFILRPSNFDPTKKYPWVLMPHGGPVSAWNDAWSTRVRCIPRPIETYNIANPCP